MKGKLIKITFLSLSLSFISSKVFPCRKDTLFFCDDRMLLYTVIDKMLDPVNRKLGRKLCNFVPFTVRTHQECRGRQRRSSIQLSSIFNYTASPRRPDHGGVD